MLRDESDSEESNSPTGSSHGVSPGPPRLPLVVELMTRRLNSFLPSRSRILVSRLVCRHRHLQRILRLHQGKLGCQRLRYFLHQHRECFSFFRRTRRPRETSSLTLPCFLTLQPIFGGLFLGHWLLTGRKPFPKALEIDLVSNVSRFFLLPFHPFLSRVSTWKKRPSDASLPILLCSCRSLDPRLISIGTPLLPSSASS